jgi:hypothetical protein
MALRRVGQVVLKYQLVMRSIRLNCCKRHERGRRRSTTSSIGQNKVEADTSQRLNDPKRLLPIFGLFIGHSINDNNRWRK